VSQLPVPPAADRRVSGRPSAAQGDTALVERRRVRTVAFYLPQYHPIPENDEWWGTGFTEWHNVSRADPLFRGHTQPHLPGDLGFYDLRLPETRAAQAALAARHGVDAFCYFHYWFAGRRLLERPFGEVLDSGEPDLPFCLCWANERWTRVWDGKSNRVLVEQTYPPGDDLAHVRALAPAFADPRYLRIDGKPVFLVYRPTKLPRPLETTDIWQAEAERLGLGGLYLCAVNGGRDQTVDPATLGMDAVVAFAPFYGLLRGRRDTRPVRALRRLLNPNSRYRRHRIFDYEMVVDDNLAVPAPPYKLFPGVSPGFDNSPRRAQAATIIVGSSPEHYERWLRETVRRFEPYSDEENLVFVNAWNEWAEGNHLEPCRRWGHGYLEAHARALS
jgi:lipopolysaccharide biosynthesis protein